MGKILRFPVERTKPKIIKDEVCSEAVATYLKKIFKDDDKYAEAVAKYLKGVYPGIPWR